MTAPLEELAEALGRERHLLEYLLFKLVAAGHLLAAGETRFLGWSSAEVERAAARVREADQQRARVAGSVATALGLPARHLSLRRLAEHSPRPFEAIFTDHHAALHTLVNEISTVTAANRELAKGGMRLVNDVVDMIETGLA